MGVKFYVGWAALGTYAMFSTLITILVTDGIDFWVGLIGCCLAAFVVGRIMVGPAQPRDRKYPSAVRARIDRSGKR